MSSLIPVQYFEPFSSGGHVEAVALMTLVAFGARLALQMLGQSWITTTAHTMTIMLLPILVYIITTVISGNVALSLGMVGALSIVRFRNPVRSPLELTVYFGSITMGIAASVHLKWLIFLCGAIVIPLLLMLAVQYISVFAFKKPFFHPSFTEGNALSTLEMSCQESISELDNLSVMVSKVSNEAGCTYVFASRNFNDLVKLEKRISSNYNITNVNLTKG